MAKTKKEKLKLVKVDYKEVVTDDGEKRMFLYTNDAEPDALYEDVKNGANIYEPIIKHLNSFELGRRVRFIKAHSKENGLKAVEYIAPMDSLADGYDLHDYDYLENSGNQSEELKDDLEDSQSRFPVISAADALNVRVPAYGLPFGEYSLNLSGECEKKRPYYSNQVTGPIVIIYNPGISMIPIDMSDILNRFQTNRRVYVIWLTTWQIVTEDDELSLTEGDDDPELLRLIIEGNASLFCLNDERTDEIEYLKCEIKNIAAQQDMKISEDFDVTSLAEVVYQCAQECFKADFVEKLLMRVKEKTNIIDEKILEMLGKSASKLAGNEKGAKALDMMVGMKDVKEQLSRYMDTLEFAAARRKEGKKANPPTTLLMLGSPGTGKTECAKALAYMATEKHLIPNSNVMIITGTELNAEYLGQTRARVQQIFQCARGGVLVIDEAYSLSDGMKGETDLFSRQAIAQMLVELDSIALTGDTIVIFAGYEDRMQKFLDANPGLRSRCSANVIRFPSYTKEQAADIFYGICRREGFATEAIENAAEVREKLVDYFEHVQQQKSYGNGRTVRNLFLQTESEMAVRIAREAETQSDLNTILPEDVIGAIKTSLDMMSSDGNRHISFLS